MKPILLVDDDPHMRDALDKAVKKIGYDTLIANDGADALSKLNTTDVSLVIADMKMPKMDGLTLLKEVRKRIGKTPFLIITGFGTVENAVEAMKEGASEYLLKPFSFDVLSKKIDSIMARFTTDREIVTASPKMLRIIQLAEEVASSDITVLIYGESGTGKELLARHIHRLSDRRDKAFIAVNCAAIPENLMESEIFGHEKGSFTGAVDKKIGKFELAGSGTILLDEIGEMAIGLQAKMLRVLQERELYRIGGNKPIKIDCRIIATTNRDLYKESLEGRFREDLYYRLNVFPLKMPSLNERIEDIPILADYFLNKFSNAIGKDISGFTNEAIRFLQNKQWRGNVRELENIIHRAVLLCRKNRIDVDDFMLDLEGAAGHVQLGSAGRIKDLERDLILKTLKDTNGNKTMAAKILGVTPRTIRNKLNEYRKNFPT